MHRLEGAAGALPPRIRVLLLTARSRVELAAGDRAAAARTLGLAAARGALDQGSPDVRAVVRAVDPAALAEASAVDPEAAVAELSAYAT